MKKAVCVGVSYPGTDHHLSEAHNDALKMRVLLMERYDYKDVKLLLDCDGSESRPVDARPTRENILKAIDDLVRNVSPGDRLVFHFSGHGTQQTEKIIPGHPREDDERDELIWPQDVVIDSIKDRHGNYVVKNAIVDNEIHERLVEKMPTGAHLTIIFDCCHSGTAADLPYIVPRGPWPHRTPQSGEEPTIVSLSACSDAQETIEFERKGGLLVYFLYELLNRKPFGMLYEELFQALNKRLENTYARLNKEASGVKAIEIKKALSCGPMRPVFCGLGSYDAASKFSL